MQSNHNCLLFYNNYLADYLHLNHGFKLNLILHQPSAVITVRKYLMAVINLSENVNWSGIKIKLPIPHYLHNKQGCNMFKLVFSFFDHFLSITFVLFPSLISMVTLLHNGIDQDPYINHSITISSIVHV